MRRSLFKSKIHRARVTHADLDYEGSVTVDASLLEAAEIVENEHVHVWNVTRGTRLETYALRGEPGSGVICMNGAAAHLMKPGDLVIIATFAEYDPEEVRGHRPKAVLVDEHNRIRQAVDREVAGPARRT